MTETSKPLNPEGNKRSGQCNSCSSPHIHSKFRLQMQNTLCAVRMTLLLRTFHINQVDAEEDSKKNTCLFSREKDAFTSVLPYLDSEIPD